jgi:hypothetical protein
MNFAGGRRGGDLEVALEVVEREPRHGHGPQDGLGRRPCNANERSKVVIRDQSKSEGQRMSERAATTTYCRRRRAGPRRARSGRAAGAST